MERIDKNMNNAQMELVWKNLPSGKTPLNADNLNDMVRSINLLNENDIDFDTNKATKTEVASLIKDIEFNEDNGMLTITRKNREKFSFDTKMGKIAINFDYDPIEQEIILTLIDGTKQYIDLSKLLTQYEFLNTDTVAFFIDDLGNVYAYVKDGSIEERHLRPDYLAEIKIEVSKAKTSADKSIEKANESETNALLSKSYNDGNTGIRDGEDTDNAKYYSEQAKKVLESLEQAGNVTGVKGDVETAYRTGNVNLTPENIGALKGKVINSSVDFNTLTENGVYIINSIENTNAPTDKDGVLFVYYSQGKTWQSYFFHGNTNNVYMYIRYSERYQWMNWLEASIDIATKALQDGNGKIIADTYLMKTGDSTNNTTTFTSIDTASPTSWTNVPVITSGEKHGIIFNKIVNMCRNVRYLYKILGTTSISSIGNGTVTGAISTINNNLSNWETLTISETYSGFKYTGGLMKYHPILKLAFISVTIQATAATTTGVKIDMCKFSKIPSVNTALSARSPNTAGQAVNVAIFTDGVLSLSTNKAIPVNGYILCSGVYMF